MTRVVTRSEGAQRYAFTDLLAESGRSRFWRASDSVLPRDVSIRLVDAGHPYRDQTERAAHLAAGVSDRTIVQVLDIFTDDGTLAIVSEWVDGDRLVDVCTEPLGEERSLAIARDVANALVALHDAGRHHRRLRPACILITEDGHTRLRGHETDAALLGMAELDAEDAVRSDLEGLGAIIYLCLTGHRIDSPVVLRQGRALPPSQVTVGVSASTDRLVAALNPGITAPAGPRPAAITSASEAVKSIALTQAVTTASSAEPSETKAPRHLGRALAAAVAAVLVAGAAIVGVSLAGATLATKDTADPLQPVPAVEAQPGAGAGGAGVPNEQTYAVIDVKAFDPYGDGEEHSNEVGYAVDGDPGTAWVTDRYWDDNIAGKGGVGLVIDLGKVQPVRSVSLHLVGGSTDLRVLGGTELFPDVDQYRTVARVRNAPQSITLRGPRPVDARYLVIWLTKLSYDGTGHRGGVAEVQVSGD